MSRWRRSCAQLVESRWPSFAHPTRCRHRCSVSALAPKPASQTAVDPPPLPRKDPYAPMASELAQIRSNLLSIMGSAHPSLQEIATNFFFGTASWQLRPLLVLLFAQATNGLSRDWDAKQWAAECEREDGRDEVNNRPLTLPGVVTDANPTMQDDRSSFEAPYPLHTPDPSRLQQPEIPLATIPHAVLRHSILPSQVRLAQIIEMIHIAFTLHEYIAPTPSMGSNMAKEGEQSTNSPFPGFGNRLFILGGDFLLGRASSALSRLGDAEVVELIASVISNMVEGEIFGTRSPVLDQTFPMPKNVVEWWHFYMKKTYLKSSSLMAQGARAAVVLGGGKSPDIWADAAYSYGRNLGAALQLLEEIKDFQSGVGVRVEAGKWHVSAPVLYACAARPEVREFVERQYSRDGDDAFCMEYVRETSGLEKSWLLAQQYAAKAKLAIRIVPDSDAKSALETLTDLEQHKL
ncbi:terpenoid synthase [Fistulina hepatica ATCC 64428]|uniref:Terpenoid synthase n=1 Tax=Fistulina hepatica ATCC 64428 TaxID=1128425 RepID=A0A0D7A7I5_9AGAR|nr:terpenoid synthase [Fistulina hepatica ATCC 64428]